MLRLAARAADALTCRKGIIALEYVVLAVVLLALISTVIVKLGTDTSELFPAMGNKPLLP